MTFKAMFLNLLASGRFGRARPRRYGGGFGPQHTDLASICYPPTWTKRGTLDMKAIGWPDGGIFSWKNENISMISIESFIERMRSAGVFKR
jgi:hypothetical protein